MTNDLCKTNVVIVLFNKESIYWVLIHSNKMTHLMTRINRIRSEEENHFEIK